MTKPGADELIRRYVYDVARRLPQKGREDIRNELMSLIQDSLGDAYSEGDVIKVLEGLGSPAGLADKYREGTRALISGEYYDKYIFMLKLVLGAVALGVCLANALSLGLDPPPDFWSGVGEFSSSLFIALSEAFAFLTLIFIIFERAGLKLDYEKWSAKDLPPVPDNSALIKKSEPISGIIFAVAVILILNLIPQYIGVIIPSEGIVIPIFNVEALRAALPLINLCFIIGIVREAARVIAGRYTIKLAVFICATDLVALIILLSVFLNPGIWNHDIMRQLTSAGIIDAGTDTDVIAALFNNLYMIFAAVTVLAYVLDMATSLYKGIRYGRKT